jgi:serine/threonine protein kinase
MLMCRARSPEELDLLDEVHGSTDMWSVGRVIAHQALGYQPFDCPEGSAECVMVTGMVKSAMGRADLVEPTAHENFQDLIHIIRLMGVPNQQVQGIWHAAWQLNPAPAHSAGTSGIAAACP